MPTFEEVALGYSTSHLYVIDEPVYETLIGAFGDVSPLHVDISYARSRGFLGKVMHGAILNGFLSHFVGVHFPGKGSLLHAVDIKYRAPNYLGEGIRIDATVVQKIEAVRVLRLDVVFTNTTQGRLVATAKVQVGLA
jgi:acyl dehydratase